jgi:hypothetical protein
MNSLTEMLVQVAEALVLYWAALGKPNMVILGRDAWPLVPLLRKKEVPCQYFLFSRLQIGDKGTEKQWKREVPVGSLVVDTGYKGSIFDAIRMFDHTIQGVLVCSSGVYPQLGLNLNHREVVREIEKMPKIIGRCVAINENGMARCPQDTRDEDENIGGMSPSDVVSYNKELCSLLGIDLEWASFTGKTPRSRTGVVNYLARTAELNERLLPECRHEHALIHESTFIQLCDGVTEVEPHIDCSVGQSMWEAGYAPAVFIQDAYKELAIEEGKLAFADDVVSEIKFINGSWQAVY